MTPIEAAQLGIREVVSEFMHDPLVALYEAGIQANLYATMRRLYPDAYELSEVVARKWIAHCPQASWLRRAPKHQRMIPVVQAEYQMTDDQNRRIGNVDIGIINPSDEFTLYSFPLSVAVEIKLGSEQMGTDQTAGFRADFRKLQTYQRTRHGANAVAVALYFYQGEADAQMDRIFIPEMGEPNLCSDMDLVIKGNGVTSVLIPSCREHRQLWVAHEQ